MLNFVEYTIYDEIENSRAAARPSPDSIHSSSYLLLRVKKGVLYCDVVIKGFFQVPLPT